MEKSIFADFCRSREGDYFRAQSNFAGRLVQFAKTRGVHVHLVAHPRKSDKTRKHLSSDDVGGSGDLTNRADNVFILSLKAAGTGLNLTAASHVIHYDLWWNPAVEAQATDRAYRIGQQKKVIVHRFITKDTFEERINAMIQQKKHLADMTVASGENWIGKLSNKELREIFG